MEPNNGIIEPTMDYDFSNLYLGPPTTIAGGSYFTRIMYKNNKQLYVQTPKSLTKQGFVKSGKKIYVDLMFDNNDTIFINWIENLESKCQELLFSKGENWFQTKLDKDDIESAFTSPFKIYKSGKFYLLRTNVKPNIKIFNESDNTINLDDISCDKTLISIIEIQGIKFSARNFQIDIELKQSMVVSPDPFLDSCFIKKPIKSQSQSQSQLNETFPDSLAEAESETKNEVEIDLNVLFNNEPNSIINSKTYSDLSDDTLVPNLVTDDNIVLEIEDLNFENLNFEEDPNALKEFDFSVGLEKSLDSITLKKPNQVYYEIYKKAREKAKDAKKAAILAFLEAKTIKNTYMLDDIDDSDDSDNSDNGDNSDNENFDINK